MHVLCAFHQHVSFCTQTSFSAEKSIPYSLFLVLVAVTLAKHSQVYTVLETWPYFVCMASKTLYMLYLMLSFKIKKDT